MTGADVAALLAAGRLERVPADPAAARARLDRAEDKLAAAEVIVTIDLDIAYVSGYDALRIAVSALMLARGLRVPANRPGAHEAVGAYAAAVIDLPSAREFQRIRRRRNKAEYDDIVIARADVDVDLGHARTVLGEVRRLIASPRP